MTPAFSARRRADDFEALVSRGDRAPLNERDAREFAALLAVVEDLRAVPEISARPEFVGDLRERLMTAADTALVPSGDRVSEPAPLREPIRPAVRQRRRLSVLLGGVALVGATATVAVASQSALPGESLYPVKRGLESAQLQFVSGADRGSAQLANATDRLAEIEALATQDDPGTTTFTADTLRSFRVQADEGAGLLLDAYADTDDRALVEQVHDFNATSMGRLTELESQLPEATHDDLVEAARTLVELDAQAHVACTVCTGGIGSIPTPSGLEVDLDVSRSSLLDVDASIPRKDVEKLEVPDIEVPDLEVPDDLVASVLPTPTPTPNATPSPTAGQTPGETVSGTTGKVKEVVKGTGEKVKGTTESVEEVTGEITGELTGTLGGATEGTIEGVTEGLGYLSGGLTGNVTEGLESGTGLSLPGTSLPDATVPEPSSLPLP